MREAANPQKGYSNLMSVNRITFWLCSHPFPSLSSLLSSSSLSFFYEFDLPFLSCRLRRHTVERQAAFCRRNVNTCLSPSNLARKIKITISSFARTREYSTPNRISMQSQTRRLHCCFVSRKHEPLPLVSYAVWAFSMHHVSIGADAFYEPL